LEEKTNQITEVQVDQDFSGKMGPHPINKRVLRRLKIIEGQVKGIQRMVEEENYCVDILRQISAVRAAINQAGMIILRRHVENCVSDAIRSDPNQSKEVIDELMEIFSKNEI
jgi:DNA-binding FrmR family transcriptional regulator